MFCTSVFGKTDRGILVMEDLADEQRLGGPLLFLNKDNIPDVKTANLVIRSLAIFHGVWISWMKNPEPKIGNLDRDGLIKSLQWPPMKKRDLSIHFKWLKSLENQMVLIGKSSELIKAFHKMRKSDFFFDISSHFFYSKEFKLLTVVHGDCWTNNFFANEDRTEVCPISSLTQLFNKFSFRSQSILSLCPQKILKYISQ